MKHIINRCSNCKYWRKTTKRSGLCLWNPREIFNTNKNTKEKRYVMTLYKDICLYYTKKEKPKEQNDSSRSSVRKQIIPPFNIGDSVFDILTKKKCKVIGITYDKGVTNNKNCNSVGTWGIYINSDYMDGARHPWELELKEK